MQLQDIRAKLAASVGGEAAFASSFSARTFRDLGERARRELDEAAGAAVEVIAGIEAAIAKAGLEEHSQFDREAFVARYVRLWAAYQHAGARTMNWMITGPARFPKARNEKRMDTEHKRLEELIAFRAGAPNREVKRAQHARAQALGPAGMALGELEDLRKRLEERELKQRQMKAVNEIIRREKLGEGDGAKLSELITARGFPMNPNLCGMLLQRGMVGGTGFAGFQLSNNNAEIRRLKDRVAQVERKAERIEQAPDEPAEREVNGVRVIENAAEDRLQLVFEGKPPAEVRDVLKRNGFRWAPSQGAWQRQLTNNARAAAERVTNAVAA